MKHSIYIYTVYIRAGHVNAVSRIKDDGLLLVTEGADYY